MKKLLIVGLLSMGIGAQTRLPFQERRVNGSNQVVLAAPPSIAADFTISLPASPPTTDGQCLATLASGQLYFAPGACEKTVSEYDWSLTVPETVTAPGTYTITLAPCPLEATDTVHPFRLFGSTGVEIVFPTTSGGAGTCTVGAATGTVKVVTTATFTGAVTAHSASSGILEAAYSFLDATNARIRLTQGSYNVYADVTTFSRALTMTCDSLGAVIRAKANNLKIINSISGTAPRVTGCAFRNDDSHTGVTAIYSNSPGAPSSGGAYAGYIERNWFVNFDKSIHSVSTNGWHVIKNHFISSPGYNATAGIHYESLNNGDQGTGLTFGNIFTCSATCDYGILWNGPGAFQAKANNFNGYSTQVHAELKFGTASASGSTITWSSGNQFRTNWAGQTIYIGGVSAVIASVDTATQITTSTSMGTLSADNYYLGGTSQAQIASNNFDSGADTLYAVRWEGSVPFQNAQIENNFVSNWTPVNNHEAISIAASAANLNFLSIKGNNIQSVATSTGTYGIRVAGGYTVAVQNNQVVGSDTGVSIETTSAVNKVSGNQCNLNDTACLTNTDATTEILESMSVTYAQLAAMAAASGSRIYCSDCTADPLAGSGSGAIASRVNGAWVGSDGSSSRWTPSGANIYRTSQVGIGGAPVGTTAMSISGGSGANELYITDATGGTAVQLIAENGYGLLGTYSNHEFHIVTDSNGRWTFGSNGMFKPFLHDTYSIGEPAKRVSAVYGRFGDFAAAGTTGDYISSRTVRLVDFTGGAGLWDMDATANGAAANLRIRDQSGSRVLQSWRVFSSSPANYTNVYSDWIPAKRAIADSDAVDDSVFPSHGSSTARWAKYWGTDIDISAGTGDILTTGTITAGVFDTTSALSYNVGGVNVITNGRAAFFTSGSFSGALSAAAGTFSGLLTAGAALTVTGNATFEGIRFAAGSTHSIGQTGTRALRVFTDGITTGGATYFENGSDLVLRPTNNFYIEGCATPGEVLTAGASGLMACAAAGSGSLPVVDTTAIVMGSADATKLLKFEVDGFTTGATRTIIFQNANYTAAGIDIAQTFNGANTFSVGQTMSDITPATNNTHINGSSGSYWNQVRSETFYVEGGRIRPTTTNTGSVGLSTARFNKGWFTDFDITGTVTPPSGTAFSGTKTVRDSAGTGTCTLTYSSGIMTGGTC